MQPVGRIVTPHLAVCLEVAAVAPNGSLIHGPLILVCPLVIIICSQLAKHGILFGELVSLIHISLVCLLHQRGRLIVQPGHILIIGLLPYPLGIAVSIASGEGSRLSHGVLHRQLAALGIAVNILLIQHVVLTVILKGLALCDLVIQVCQLLIIFPLILSRDFREVHAFTLVLVILNPSAGRRCFRYSGIACATGTSGTCCHFFTVSGVCCLRVLLYLGIRGIFVFHNRLSVLLHKKCHYLSPFSTAIET